MTINRERLKRAREERRKPFWQGPEIDGVTQGKLSGYMCCRERTRVRLIEGLGNAERFDKVIEYGQFWHHCEEELSATGKVSFVKAMEYAQQLAARYPMDRAEINKWYRICTIQFPIYEEYWREHEDNVGRIPLEQETEFFIPYKLPSGRTVTLCGKWDAVDRIQKKGVWLQENKSKGTVDKSSLTRQLTYDLQTMTYLVALWEYGYKPRGVRYNVIRRPLSGGAGTIRKRKGSKNVKAETWEQYYDRLGKILSSTAESYFTRWEVPVSKKDVDRFRKHTLDPVLENLYDDWEWWSWCYEGNYSHWDAELRRDHFPHHLPRHYRLPYGVYNKILEGGTGDLDNYLDTGNMVGLQRVRTLFPELETHPSNVPYAN